MARRANKWSPITIGTGSHAFIEIETHGSQAHAPNDDIVQHGGLTRVNTPSLTALVYL